MLGAAALGLMTLTVTTVLWFWTLLTYGRPLVTVRSCGSTSVLTLWVWVCRLLVLTVLTVLSVVV